MKNKINLSKSKYIILPYRKQFLLPNIQLGAENIEVTNSINFLGIALDEKLKFRNQVGVKSNINKMFNAFFPSEVLKMLY